MDNQKEEYTIEKSRPKKKSIKKLPDNLKNDPMYYIFGESAIIKNINNNKNKI
jgi:hypothetical protein